jgi:replication factor C subunit 2/4
MAHLWKLGYAAEDIIGNIFRVTKSMQMSEELKLDFIKVDAVVLCHCSK